MIRHVLGLSASCSMLKGLVFRVLGSGFEVKG
jgi:hypothetical protein